MIRVGVVSEGSYEEQYEADLVNFTWNGSEIVAVVTSGGDFWTVPMTLIYGK